MTMPWDRFPTPDQPPPPPPLEPELPYRPRDPASPPVAIDLASAVSRLEAIILRGQQAAPPTPAKRDAPKERKTMDKFKEMAKAVAAGIGSLLMVLTFVSDNFGNFLPDNIGKPLIIIIGILTTVVTWLVPNKPKTEEGTP